MLEIVLAFQAASAAIEGIRTCCNALNEGRAEIQRIKKTVEGGVNDAKAIYQEVTGLWSWIQGLLGLKPKPKQLDDIHVADTTKSSSAAPAKPSKKSKKDEFVEHIPTPDELTEQFTDHLGNFLDAQATILDAIEADRERIFNTFDGSQNNRKEAMNLIKYERKINAMAMELSSILAAAPRSLGPVREEFQEKYDLILDKQSEARERARVKRLQEQWQRDLLRNHRIDRAMATVGVFVLLMWMWGVLLSLRWLVRTPDGL